MFWFCCWMIAFCNDERSLEERSDWTRPAAWSGGFWGPAGEPGPGGRRARPMADGPGDDRWILRGRDVLHEGDIVFRRADASAMGGFALSRFVARARQPVSHTGIVAIEEGRRWSTTAPRTASGEAVRGLDARQRRSHGRQASQARARARSPAVRYCRTTYEKQVPFDYEFRPGRLGADCVEMTEKAFRSQGLALSEPVRLGDWEHLSSYPITARL